MDVPRISFFLGLQASSSCDSEWQKCSKISWLFRTAGHRSAYSVLNLNLGNKNDIAQAQITVFLGSCNINL